MPSCLRSKTRIGRSAKWRRGRWARLRIRARSSRCAPRATTSTSKFGRRSSTRYRELSQLTGQSRTFTTEGTKRQGDILLKAGSRLAASGSSSHRRRASRSITVTFVVNGRMHLLVRSNISEVFRSKLSHILVAIVGAGLLIFTVQRVGGWPAVVEGITSVGWWFILVVLLGAVRMACRARAWVVCADDPHLRFRDAFGAMLAGDAAGNLTPLGVLASEPTKILMSRTRISTVTSIASVAIENAFYIVSVSIVLLAGTWIFLQRADVPAGLEQISEAILVGDGDRRDRRRLGRAHASGGVVASRTAGDQAGRTIGRAGGRRSRSRVAHLRRTAMARGAHSACGRTGRRSFTCWRSPKCGWCCGCSLAPSSVTLGRCVPDGECRAVRHRCLQVRPVPVGHRRNGIGRGGASARPSPSHRRDARARTGDSASSYSTPSGFSSLSAAVNRGGHGARGEFVSKDDALYPIPEQALVEVGNQADS